MVSKELDADELQESRESLKLQLLEDQKEIARLNEELTISKTLLATAEADLVNSNEEIKRQLEESSDLKSRRFCINNLSANDLISFCTGFPILQTFQATLLYLNPGVNGENISYWRSVETKVDENLYDENSETRDRNLGEREL